MRPPELYAHLLTAIGYPLGRVPQTPDEGGFFGHWIAAPLILNGIIKIPQNQPAPSMYAAAPPSASVEEVAQVLEDYLAAQAKPDFAPPPHPFFGNIGPRGWSKLHIVHLEHHLRQFGASPVSFTSGS